MKNVKIIKCKAKDLMRELAIKQLDHIQEEEVKRIKEVVKNVNL